jgi:hypothetical protein
VDVSIVSDVELNLFKIPTCAVQSQYDDLL